MIVSAVRVHGALEDKHIVSWAGTHVVCRNEVGVCAVMLWR